MNKIKTATLIGIGTGLLMGVIIITGLLSNFGAQQIIGFVLFLTLILGVITSVLVANKQSNYTHHFGKLFGAGFNTTAAATLLCIVFTIACYLLKPEWKKRELQQMRTAMLEKKFSEKEINDYASNVDDNYLKLKINRVSFPFFISGAMFAALAAAAASHKNKTTR